MAGGHWQRSTDELLHAMSKIETRRRQDYALSLEMLSELTIRNVTAETGYPSLAVLLRDVLRLGTGEVRRRLRHMAAVTETPLVSGGALPAALPVTAAALRDGLLGTEHVDVITRTLGDLPAHVPAADRDEAERIMVDAARGMDGGALTRVGHRVREWLDQDGTPPDDRELAEPVNELHLTTRANGRTAVRGDFDPEASALLRAVLSPLAAPRPGSDTGPDPRSTAERQGDALVEALRLTADSGTLPSEAGEKPHLLVTIPLQALRSGIGQATLHGAGQIDARAARRIACDAKIIPVVLGSRSEPLDLGRAAYTVTAALRRALILRDGGCAFPSCHRSYRWCDAHHVRHWADGGPTDLNNLTLLCGQHHRIMHHSDWRCAIRHGRPEFAPPPFIDATRTPRRNLLLQRQHAIPSGAVP